MKKLFECVCGDQVGCHERTQEAVCKHRRRCGCTGFNPARRVDRIRMRVSNFLWPHSWLPHFRLVVNEAFIMLLLIALGAFLLLPWR